MYSDDALVPISALQHIAFCERQCALIHIGRVWDENRLTVEGRHLHERVDEGGHESRKNRRNEYRVPLVSFRLGLTGFADLVEYTLMQEHNTAAPPGAAKNTGGKPSSMWQPYPVEFKRGTEKETDVDRVQVCAQAMCLEEMTGVPVPEGALFYAADHRRTIVVFDEQLRSLTESLTKELHDLFSRAGIPAAVWSDKCRNCSLKELCMPAKAKRFSSASSYVNSIIEEVRNEATA